MYSQSEENYIKAIFELSLTQDKVSTNLLAQYLNTKASSISEMIKKLADKDLVEYVKYQGVILSSEGRVEALKLIRKHRIWEVFLVDVLNFDWHKVHDIAEQLEHIKSNELIDKLDAFLKFPKTDPHGEPIPNSSGDFRTPQNKLKLSDMNEGELVVIKQVDDDSSQLLEFLHTNDLKLRKTLKVLKKYSFDNSMEIELENGLKKNLSQIVSNSIYVETL